MNNKQEAIEGYVWKCDWKCFYDFTTKTSKYPLCRFYGQGFCHYVEGKFDQKCTAILYKLVKIRQVKED